MFASTKEHKEVDPLEVLIQLYIGGDTESLVKKLTKCRINPSFNSNYTERRDLEFYISQLVNYMVFHEELKNENLLEFVRQAGYADFFFGHLLYFYLKSVSKSISKKKILSFPAVENMLNAWAEDINKDYQNHFLIAAVAAQQL